MANATHLWPEGQESKTLLSLRVHCKAEDLFKTLWEQPDLNVSAARADRGPLTCM